MKKELQDKLNRLGSLIKKMDVPKFKRTNPGWLSRNLAIRNSTHPLFEETIQLIKELISNGVTHD